MTLNGFVLPDAAWQRISPLSKSSTLILQLSRILSLSSKRSFEDTKRIMSPEMRPKSFGTFEKRAPDQKTCALSWLFRIRGPFLERPDTFRAHFGWHNPLCIFKTKASRSRKLCSYFNFYSLYNVWKDQLYRVSGSEVYELLFGPKKLAEISKRAPGLSWSSIGERINHYSLDKYHQNVWNYPVNNEFPFGYCTTKT